MTTLLPTAEDVERIFRALGPGQIRMYEDMRRRGYMHAIAVLTCERTDEAFLCEMLGIES